MTPRTPRLLIASALLALVPGVADAGDIHARIGAFFPRADMGRENSLFADVNELFTRDSSLAGIDSGDWVGAFGGAEYSIGIGELLEVGLHVDGYGRSLDTFYRDFEDDVGRDIQQTLRLTVVPTGITLRIAPGNRAGIEPYVGGGIDAVWYRYEEFGDFIDFFDPAQPIVPDAFEADGWAFGAHAVAGVRVPLNYDFALVAEGRYLWAQDDMGQDFRLNHIDLSGGSVTLGVLIRF